MLSSGLPGHENARLHNIHFITCSNSADATDIMDPRVTQLEEGIPAYHAEGGSVVAPVMAFPCDNRRHFELLKHAGGHANKLCQTCLQNFLDCLL